ncbi:hypothetical protein C8N32_10843 [Rhodovulum imhoffii]|uniref:Uncharacterized protein n=2 Tax=Rhodovulum imhoffii TaxID=365340 RepID=A0A2T5BS17_9RHOB|nr:hypothetical protein [Rhodovulum imhoffii]MBK5933153.1 hypothetical protein [Rhodovulum imhoffii]PTN02093.1 hypothetical protein C8N32_10843 [Rhodovulum imhoffii]
MTDKKDTMFNADALKTDDPTPLSSRMNWQLLSDNPDTPMSVKELKTDDPTPFSRFMKLPLLSDRKSSIKLMTDNPTPFSSRMGWDLLSDKTPFESTPGTAKTGEKGEGAFSRFLRGIVTGEVQK